MADDETDAVLGYPVQRKFPVADELEKAECVAVEVFPVFGQPATAVEPSDGAFDDPALGQHDKAGDPIGSLDMDQSTKEI